MSRFRWEKFTEEEYRSSGDLGGWVCDDCGETYVGTEPESCDTCAFNKTREGFAVPTKAEFEMLRKNEEEE